MSPHIDETHFGSITINGKVYQNDVVIDLNGQVKKRKKKLSKNVYGTSHKISLEEAESLYETGTKKLIIGTGQTSYVKLSSEAADYLVSKGCEAALYPPPGAIEKWNQAKGNVIALFHITC